MQNLYLENMAFRSTIRRASLSVILSFNIGSRALSRPIAVHIGNKAR